LVGWRNYYQWDNIGYWITRGIAEGIRGSAATSWISSAARYVINMVRNEIRAATGEGSLATKFIPHGMFMVQGVAKDIVSATSVARMLYARLSRMPSVSSLTNSAPARATARWRPWGRG
jgi:hypothetical protein